MIGRAKIPSSVGGSRGLGLNETSVRYSGSMKIKRAPQQSLDSR